MKISHNSFFRSLLLSVLIILLLNQLQSSSAQTSNATSNSNQEVWNIYHAIGKFLYNNPPKSDGIFLIKYSVTNGVIHNFTANQGDFITDVSSTSDNSTLELKIPRNYPYTNIQNMIGGARLPILFFNSSQVLYNNVSMNDCFFDYVIPFSGHQKIDLAYTYLVSEFAYHGDPVPDYCMSEATMVPEFPFAIPILIASIASFIILSRIKFKTRIT